MERFVCLLYDIVNESSVNNACLALLINKGKDISDMPPSKDARFQHLLRSVLQSAHILGNIFTSVINNIQAEFWGWETVNNIPVRVYTTKPKISFNMKEFVK